MSMLRNNSLNDNYDLNSVVAYANDVDLQFIEDRGHEFHRRAQASALN